MHKVAIGTLGAGSSFLSLRSEGSNASEATRRCGLCTIQRKFGNAFPLSLSSLFIYQVDLYITHFGQSVIYKAIFLAFKQLNLYFTSLSPTLKKLWFFENDVVLQFCNCVMMQFGAPRAQSLVDLSKLHDCTSTKLHIFHHDFHIMRDHNF